MPNHDKEGLTDEDKKPKARGGKCDHPNCYGEPCKQWADEEFQPGPDDLELAKKLVDDGWMSVSSKYRRIVRWKEPPPDTLHLVNPELRNTYWGRLAFALLGRHLGVRMEHELQHEAHRMHRPVNSGLVEERTLTLKEFMAFKKLREERKEKDRALYKKVDDPVS
jgi:hypothetical protein